MVTERQAFDANTLTEYSCSAMWDPDVVQRAHDSHSPHGIHYCTSKCTACANTVHYCANKQSTLLYIHTYRMCKHSSLLCKHNTLLYIHMYRMCKHSTLLCKDNTLLYIHMYRLSKHSTLLCKHNKYLYIHMYRMSTHICKPYSSQGTNRISTAEEKNDVLNLFDWLF
jgi:hypothetical protein